MRHSLKRPSVNLSTNLGLYCVAILVSLIAAFPASAAEGYRLPWFRPVQAVSNKLPEVAAGGQVRLLADQDFPPFSFASQTGGPAGLAVELALAACAEAKLVCEVSLRPFIELLPALQVGQADVIIAGPRLDEPILDRALMTRPWFRTMGRFAVLKGNPLKDSDVRSLNAKRVGVVKDTLHERWLASNYSAAEIVSFDDDAKAGEALRSGSVDAVFGDNLRLIYWLSGPAAAQCCRVLGGAYTDFQTFSRNLAFLVTPGSPELREAFDHGLDMAQVNGTTEKIFNTYVPLNPW